MNISFGISPFFHNFVPNNSYNSMQKLLTLRPMMEDCSLLQPYVAQAAEAAKISGVEEKRLRLAVEEAVANVINYGQATSIRLRYTVETDRLVLTIDDDGIPFDPTQGSATDLSVPPDERPPGGLGIIMMHQMTDSLSYQRIEGHNILRIEKKNNNINNHYNEGYD